MSKLRLTFAAVCTSMVMVLVHLARDRRHYESTFVFNKSDDVFVVKQMSRKDDWQLDYSLGEYKCPDGSRVQICGQELPCTIPPDILVYHFKSIEPGCKNVDFESNALYMVYKVESLAYYPDSECWQKFDFMLRVDLDTSFPFALTYFRQIGRYLSSLLTFPQEVDKRKGIVWLCSNCDAPNKRHVFVKNLMKILPIDSYGACLTNVDGTFHHGKKGVDLYRTYKFVIAIENSNCKDYITEKYVESIEARAVPIVASTDGKPDYERFGPPGAHVNIYDFSDLKDLAKYLNESLNNDVLYLQRHFNYVRREDEGILSDTDVNASDLLNWSRFVRFRDYKFSRHLLAIETGDDTLCRLGRYIRNERNSSRLKAWQLFQLENSKDNCLNNMHMVQHFKLD